ncbi:unnamed protein product [Rhodiola kirilowii]
MELPTQNNDDREAELAQCRKLELHPSEDVVGKYISFRIRKDFNIEPETSATHSKVSLSQLLHNHQISNDFVYPNSLSPSFQIGGVLNQKLHATMTEDDLEESDEFLSAYEGDTGQDSTGNSSASSFTFPVLDGRWSGSPVKMPKRKQICCLKKLIVGRWCREPVASPRRQQSGSQELTLEAARRSQELTIGGSKFAEIVSETAKKSKEIAAEATKRSQELTIGGSKFSDIVSETAKKSKEIAAEASKRADQIRTEALKGADKIKSFAEGITPTAGLSSSSEAVSEYLDPERFGVTDDLREFVKEITINTFRDFPLEDDSEISDVPTVSNVRQDLSKWQEIHAKLVLSTVKEISKLRYELCPKFMKERKFWRIYFLLVNTHVAPYEKRYTEDLLKEEEEVKIDSVKEATSKSEIKHVNNQIKTSASASEQDLDVFLLGDLGDSDDGGPDDGDDGLDDDFDKMADSSEDEEKHKEK